MKILTYLPLLTLFLFCSCDLDRPEELQNWPHFIYSPAEGQILRAQLVEFKWSSVSNATEYKLFVSTFDSLELNELVFDTVVIYTNQFQTFMNPGTYIWQVEASNYVSVIYSEQNSFRIDTTTYLPDFTSYDVAVDLFYPVDSVTYDAWEQIELRWHPLESANSYQVLIVSPSFAQPKWSKETQVYAEKHIQSLDSGTYQWTIRPYAVNNIGQGFSGNYSEIRTFFVRK